MRKKNYSIGAAQINRIYAYWTIHSTFCVMMENIEKRRHRTFTIKRKSANQTHSNPLLNEHLAFTCKPGLVVDGVVWLWYWIMFGNGDMGDESSWGEAEQTDRLRGWKLHECSVIPERRWTRTAKWSPGTILLSVRFSVQTKEWKIYNMRTKLFPWLRFPNENDEMSLTKPPPLSVIRY